MRGTPSVSFADSSLREGANRRLRAQEHLIRLTEGTSSLIRLTEGTSSLIRLTEGTVLWSPVPEDKKTVPQSG